MTAESAPSLITASGLLSDSVVFTAEFFSRHNKTVYRPAAWQTQSRSIAFVPIKLFHGLPIIKRCDVGAHLRHAKKKIKLFFHTSIQGRVYEACRSLSFWTDSATFTVCNSFLNYDSHNS